MNWVVDYRNVGEILSKNPLYSAIQSVHVLNRDPLETAHLFMFQQIQLCTSQVPSQSMLKPLSCDVVEQTDRRYM